MRGQISLGAAQTASRRIATYAEAKKKKVEAAKAPTFSLLWLGPAYDVGFGRDEEASFVFARLASASDFPRRLVCVFVPAVAFVSAGAVVAASTATALAAFAVTGSGTIVRRVCSVIEATASVLAGSGLRNASQRYRERERASPRRLKTKSVTAAVIQL